MREREWSTSGQESCLLSQLEFTLKATCTNMGVTSLGDSQNPAVVAQPVLTCVHSVIAPASCASQHDSQITNHKALAALTQHAPC